MIKARGPRRLVAPTLALAAALSGAGAANAAVDWSGDLIHGQFDYPNKHTVFRDLGVSPLPFTGTVANSTGFVLLAFQVDASQIVISSASVPFNWRSGAFNGFVFTDASRNPHIDSVTLDPATTAPASAADATFNAGAVFLNFQGQSWSSGQQAVFDIGFGNAVPEPTAWTLMLLGIGCVGGALRGSRRARAYRRPAASGGLS